MPTDSEMLKERQKLRYQVLKAMYDKTVGRGEDIRTNYFPADHIAEGLSLPFEEVSSALKYLCDELLIISSGEFGLQYEEYRLEHKGVIEIEQSVQEPKEHFPSQIITQNFHSQVGAVQNAPHATAYINQPSGASLSEVLSLIEQLKIQAHTLPEDQREDASDDLEAIEEELNTQVPRRRNIKTLLRGLDSTAQGGTAFAANLATLLLRLQELGLA